MKRKIRKRILALLCIVSIFVSTNGIVFQTKAEKPLETLNPTMEQITFSNYGWADDTYSGTSDLVTKYGYQSSVVGKVFSGNMTFSASASYMYLNGADKGIWKGLSLKSGSEDDLILSVGGVKYTLTPEIAGVKLVENTFNLKLSFEVANNTLNLGVWFNDKLYNNEYIPITTYGENGTYKDYLTGGLGIHAPGEASLRISSDVPQMEVLDSNLEQITFSDYGWVDSSFTSMPDISTKYGYGESLNGKVISGKITFSGDNARIYVGGGDLGIWKGLNFKSESNGNLTFKLAGEEYTLTPAVAGVTLVDNPFNLKLSYQTVDTDEDGTKDCLKLGVWFNNKLYNNKYFMVSKYGDNRTYNDYLIGGLGIYAIGLSGLTIVSDYVQTLDPSLEKVTFSDYGWDNGKYSNMPDILTKYGYGETLNGKVISGTVTFSANEARVYIGGGDLGIWKGLSLQSSSDGNLKLKLAGEDHIITPATAGVTLIDNPLNLKLSYQVIDADEDGTEDTLRLGVWFSDKLYNNEYFEVTTFGDNRTYKDYLTGGIGIYAPSVAGGTASLTIESDVPEVLDLSLKEITFSNFGWEDGTYSNMTDISAKYGYGEKFESKVISGEVTFSESNAQIYVGGGELGIWKGLCLQSGQKDGNLKLNFGGKEYTLTPKVAGVTLIDNPFNLKLSYQVLDTDADESKDTLRLGVWFNDKLYNNEYFEVSTYGENRSYVDYLSGGIGIYAPKFAGGTGMLTIASDELVVLPTNYECVTPFDFGIVYDTYPGPGTGGEPYGNFSTKAPLTSMDEVLFEAKITFGESTQLRYMRTTTSEWAGLEMSIQNDGSIYVINHLTNSSVIWVDNEEINTADEGYFMYPGIAVSGATTFIGQPLYLAFTTKFVACDEDGEVNDLKLGIWFNEELYGEQYIYIKDCINVCEPGLFLYRMGEGSIVLETPEKTKRTETNERYNLADGPYLISGTGTILVNDVEYENGATLTEPGTYRIVSNNGVLVRNVELYNTGKKSSTLTYEDNVMPIVGFYGPHSNEYSDSVTEEVYQMLEDAGFNLINYIPKNWSVRANQAELIQNLIYAETHNMGLYVWDSTLLASDLTATAIAKGIAPYSQYGSFKGIHVVDEPGTESYHPDWENQLDTYAALTKEINGYCNLNGYINLFPYDNLYGDYDIYGAYVDEYISKTEAKLLSYDYYVFANMEQSEYFENLYLAREKSIEHGIPFWPYIQAGSWRVRNNNGQPFYEEGTPDKGQFMWNVNTSLAYGAKGIQYYTAVMPYRQNYTGYDYGILNDSGEPTDWYYYAKEINEHIAAIDEVLLAAESKAVLAIGTNAKRDTNISATNYGKLSSVSLSDTTEGSVIGAFEYQGNEAFYIVNYDMSDQETITLNFAQSYEYRLIQDAVTSYGKGSTCELTIPAGEAVLVVLNSTTNPDLNDDGILSADDLGILRNALLIGTIEDKYDVNGDAKIDVRDLVSMKKKLPI